jgi:fluoride exporter
MMNPILQVALGGAAGAVARHAVSRILAGQGHALSTATCAVNVAGSFAMGLLAVALSGRLGSQYAPLVLTGLLGGFTTFSAFSLDAVTLWERGQVGNMGIYVLGSVLLSMVAVMAGLAVGRGLWT